MSRSASSVSGAKLRSSVAVCGIDGLDRHELYSDASLTKGGGEDARAQGDVFRRGVFVGPVADAAAAGDEDHGDGRDPGHERASRDRRG